jgi:selenocysteine lyase/cysteine desulfurase
MDVQAIEADFIVADGHKWLMAPEGLALFYCRAALREQLNLRQFGWHMVENMFEFDRRDWRPADSARRFECGSPNMLGIHGLSASLSLLLELGMSLVEQQICAKGTYMAERLQGLDGIQVCAESRRRGGIVAFRHADIAVEALYQHLQQHNIICAIRQGSIRFSAHFYTRQALLDHALEVVAKALV